MVTVVLDGVGIGRGDEADAVKIARTPNMDRMWAPGLRCSLAAHGIAVGLPSDDDMGNSEVGHNAMGAGRVLDQGARRVNAAIASGELFEGPVWKEAVGRAAGGGALHFIGLLSDGNVHSHIDHLIALLEAAAQAGATRLFVHVLVDGRDVPPHSALEYIDRLETVLARISASGKTRAAIASGGGRMVITMDRYGADWGMVERGWDTHVRGQGRRFSSAREAIATLRDEHPGIGDQRLPPFVIAADGQPVGPITSGDAVLCFNFRGDRAIEISRAFEEDDFSAFDRGPRPDVLYAGMMEYDGDTHIPHHYLVDPPHIDATMGEYFAASGLTQLAIAETQKFGHVTYFWNGNRSGKFDDALETYIEVPSDTAPFEERPWMKAAEVTDRLIAELCARPYTVARVNYANGDMVGHTGSLAATVVAIEAIDLSLGRLCRVMDQLGGILVVTADHGNADEMYLRDNKGAVVRDRETGAPVVKTSHTLSPVPLMIYDPNRADRYTIDESRATGAGIASVTSTVIELCGLEPPEGYLPSLLRVR